MKRWVSRICVLTVVVALSPLWAFELLYGYELLHLGPALQAPPATGAKALALETLWLASGEQLDSGVRPLWAGDFFESASGDPHGSAAAYQIASARLGRLGVHEIFEWHLRTAALTVWLTRHEGVADLQRTLAAETDFGRGAIGLDAAALTYFRRPIAVLTPAQIALLVGLAQSPSRFDPSCHPQLAAKRRESVLRRMAESHLISDATLWSARSEAATALPGPCALSQR